MLRPDSIVARTALVLVAAVALVLVVTVALFAGHRNQALAALGGRNAAERVAGLVSLLEETPPEIRMHTLRSMETPGLRAGWSDQPIVDEDEESGLAAEVGSLLRRSLDGRQLRVSTAASNAPLGLGFGYGRRMMMGGGPGPGPLLNGPAVRVSVMLGDGTWLNVVAPIQGGESLWRLRLVGPLAVALLMVTLAALWAVRRATRPFDRFAAAAERLGVDVAAPPMAEDGPREVRRAAQAFNRMQGRIRRFVEDRTQLLAAISHDLRTPITRLKLRAEFVEDETERARMLADLDEMERMIAATLAFARDDAAREDRRPVDVAALVQGLAEDLGVSYAGPHSLVAAARPMALKRAVANLLGNAVKYGPPATVTVSESAAELCIAVEDSGPGIPEADRERVFAPFVRLETSRSRDTGGTGLGLAVARAAARAHGGDIRLEDGPGGVGLRAILTLPGGKCAKGAPPLTGDTPSVSRASPGE